MQLSILQYSIYTFTTLVLGAGLILDVFVVACFLKYAWGRFQYKKQLAPFTLLVMSGFWAFNGLLINVETTINGRILNSWCQYNGVVITLATGGTLSGHIFLACDRYFIVIRERTMSWHIIITYICVSLAYILTTIFIALFHSKEGFVPMEGELWCFFNFTEMNTADRVANMMVLSLCIASTTVMNHAYLSVYLKTRRTIRANMEDESVTTSSSANHQDTQSGGRYADVESRVFYRCLLLTGSFVAFFAPSFIAIVYRIATGWYVADWVDDLTMAWCCLDCLTTPILVCYMSVDFKQASMAYLPVKWRRGLKRFE